MLKCKKIFTAYSLLAGLWPFWIRLVSCLKLVSVDKDVCQLLIDFEKAYDSIKRESLYDILIKFGVPKKLVRLIKTSYYYIIGWELTVEIYNVIFSL